MEPSRDIMFRILETHHFSSLQKLKTLRNRVSEARRKCLDAPNFLFNDIPERYMFLKNGDKFVQYDSGYNDPRRIIILGTFEKLNVLAECKYWVMDGTFYVAPSEFEQLYVI